MKKDQENQIIGLTGNPLIDGILTPEQQTMLDSIQTRAANKCLDYLDNHQEGMLFPLDFKATGFGKGKIAHKIIEGQITRKSDSKILYITGTKIVLVDQTHKALGKYIESEDDDEIIPETTDLDNTDLNLNNRSYLYSTGKIGSDANVQVGTIQTVQAAINKRSLNPDDYDLVIVDEVHNIGTKKRKETIQKFKKAAGLTATPFRHSGRMKKPEDYGFTVVDSLPLPDAQELMLLPPLLGIQIDTKEVVDEIPLTNSGTIDYKALEQVLKSSPELRPYIAERVYRIISSEEKQYKTVIAVNFVWEAEELAKLLKDKGLTVGIAINKAAAKKIHTEEIPTLDSLERYKLPKEDERSIQVLISPYVASEGFDAPFTEVLVWASPTDSSLRYTQYTGRLARRNPGKMFGVVVDCLYQTNQYNWSYNMGMWMKGDVKQLENGFLWLGPEKSIEEIKQLSILQELNRQNDPKTLMELQNEGTLEVQEEDFIVTVRNLMHQFVGDHHYLRELGNVVLEKIKTQDSTLVVKRRIGPRWVTVVTKGELFMSEMINHGAKTRDKHEFQDGDFGLSRPLLLEYFSGDGNSLLKLAHESFEDLKSKNINIFIEKFRMGKAITVVIDPPTFIDEMLRRGAKIKETNEDIHVTKDELSDNDYVISQKTLREDFIGDYSTVVALANQIASRLATENPDSIVKIKSGGVLLTTVRDRTKFIEYMTEAGAVIKEPELLDLKESDFPISISGARLFIGVPEKISSAMELTSKELTDQYPELFQKRRNHSHIIDVCINKELFVQKMTKKGFLLKDEETVEIQENDFVITTSGLKEYFVGDSNKLLAQGREALELVRNSNPDFVATRRRKVSYITVVTDKQLFIDAMIDIGAKLRN